MDGTLYLDGEERFGSATSRFYAVSRLIPTMRHFYSFVLNDLSSLEFLTILDIGTGDGYELVSLAEAKNGFIGYGIDPSPQMVKVARRRAAKRRVESRIKFDIGSSRNIPGGENFDIIYSSLSFHHWKEREAALAGIMSRLNEGGSFIIYETSDDGTFNRKFVKSHLMNRNEFEQIAPRNSLELKRISENGGFIAAEFGVSKRTA